MAGLQLLAQYRGEFSIVLDPLQDIFLSSFLPTKCQESPQSLLTLPNVLYGFVFLLLRTTDLIGRQDAGKVKLYQKTSVTALENNDRYVIRSHIFDREVVKGLSLLHFKEPTLVKARIRQSRNRDGS